jgi:hypothetical protein
MRAIVILRRRLIRAWSLRAEQLRCVSKLRAHTAPVCVLLCAEKSGLLISASDDARWIVRARGRAGAAPSVTTTTYCELQRRVLEVGRCACGVLGRNGRSPLAQKEHTPRSSFLACRRRATPTAADRLGQSCACRIGAAGPVRHLATEATHKLVESASLARFGALRSTLANRTASSAKPNRAVLDGQRSKHIRIAR